MRNLVLPSVARSLTLMHAVSSRFCAWLFGLICMAGVICPPAPAAAHSSATPATSVLSREHLSGNRAPSSTDVRTWIKRLEAETEYRFLYRDAAIAGTSVTFTIPSGTSDEAIIRAFGDVLQAKGLDLRIDVERKQVLVVRASRERPEAITGVVVDGATGTRLPLATVLWQQGGGQTGTATDDAGRFRIRLRDDVPNPLLVRISYVGYATRTVQIALTPPPADLTIRLQPRETQAPEVVVQTEALVAGLDTTWQHLLRAERYAPLGESNALRALQPLPSIGVTGAITGGLVVRGSRPDGFQVMLDGAPIYNAHHVFGLFDAFNADALHTVGLYYGVAPATIAAPPGGTLSFRTRTGSQTSQRTTLHASSTAGSVTVEGPWDDGRGSYLVSARRSYLNRVSWLGNDQLIEQGLDVDRPRDALPPNAIRELGDLVTRPLAPRAGFYDVHVNVYNEQTSGQRITGAFYAGADQASQSLAQLVRDNTNPNQRFRVDTLQTNDRWGNVSGSISVEESLSDRAFGRVTVAGTRYFTRYTKDNFVYRSRDPETGQSRFLSDTFSNRNTLTELKVEPRVDLALSDGGIASIGGTAHLYNVAYKEERLQNLPRFSSTYDEHRSAARVDLFAHLDASSGPVDLSLGIRTHMFTDGGYLRLSPRLRVRAWPKSVVSVGAGYTRSHQFLHRLDIVGETSSAVWVPSTQAQPPGRVDHLTGGIYLSPRHGPSIQVEGYLKAQENVRIHDTLPRLRPGDTTVLFSPWSVDNESLARGLEVLIRQPIGPVAATAGYTWSRVGIDPPDRPEQPAPWDRRHQLTTRLETAAGPWSGGLTGTYATGVPSDYAQLLPGEPERLGDTARLDASVQYERLVGNLKIRARVAVYNLTGRDNPWYRTPVPYLIREGGFRSPIETEYAILDVYDLGRQPSFTVTATF